MISPTKNKSIKPLPIILGVIIASVITMLMGWIFARADLIRFFMGNTRYAEAFAKGTVNAIADNELADSILISGLSSYLSTGEEQYEKYEQYIKDHPDNALSYKEYEDILLKTKIFSSLQQIFPKDGVSLEAGVRAEPEEKLCQLISDLLYIDRADVEKAFNDLNSAEVNGTVSVKEDGADIYYYVSQGDIPVIDSTLLYYDPKGGSLYCDNSQIYIYTLRADVQPLIISDEKYSIDKGETEKARKALISELADIYLKHLQNARTNYSNAVESVGSGRFSGKSMSAVFEKGVLIEFFKDIIDAFYDSDYFNIILKAAFEGNIPDRISIEGLKKKAMEGLDRLDESSDAASLTVEFYINKNNSFAGLSVRTNLTQNGTAHSSQIKYINTKRDTYAEVTADGSTYLRLQGEKASGKLGTLNIEIDLPKDNKREKPQNLDITVKYRDIDHKRLFGKDQLLGVFDIDVSGSLLEELSLLSDAVDYGSLIEKSSFTVSAESSIKGIKYGLGIKNESYGNVTFTADIGEDRDHLFEQELFRREDRIEYSTVDMSLDNPDTLKVKLGALKHIKELGSQNGALKICFDYFLRKRNINSIDEEIQKLEEQLN